MPEFASEAQQQVFERIRPWMQELFGNLLQGARDSSATLYARVGSARTETTVQPWGDGDATITTRACVTAGSRVDEALLLYLRPGRAALLRNFRGAGGRPLRR